MGQVWRGALHGDCCVVVEASWPGGAAQSKAIHTWALAKGRRAFNSPFFRGRAKYLNKRPRPIRTWPDAAQQAGRPRALPTGQLHITEYCSRFPTVPALPNGAVARTRNLEGQPIAAEPNASFSPSRLVPMYDALVLHELLTNRGFVLSGLPCRSQAQTPPQTSPPKASPHHQRQPHRIIAGRQQIQTP